METVSSRRESLQTVGLNDVVVQPQPPIMAVGHHDDTHYHHHHHHPTAIDYEYHNIEEEGHAQQQDDDYNNIVSKRRNDFRAMLEHRKLLTLQQDRNRESISTNGPPMYVNATLSKMSVVSDLSARFGDMAIHPSSSDIVEDYEQVEDHPGVIYEDIQFQSKIDEQQQHQQQNPLVAQEETTTTTSEKGNLLEWNSKQSSEEVPKEPPQSVEKQPKSTLETVNNELNPTTNNPPSSDESYSRMLEMELVDLKMKLAHAQCQIDEQPHHIKKKQKALYDRQHQLQTENASLKRENQRLMNQLQKEWNEIRNLKVLTETQERVIQRLQDDLEQSDLEKDELSKKSNLLQNERDELVVMYGTSLVRGSLGKSEEI